MSDKQKYRLTFRCDCGNEFKKITTNKDLTTATCPQCKKKESERRLRLGDGAISSSDMVEQPNILAVEKYSCGACGKFTRFYKEAEGDKLGHCQHCGSEDVKYMGYIPSGVISTSSQNMIRAVDATAKMTMETYGMTDINMGSNMRPGDICTPKLPPAQQAMADGMFNHAKSPMAKNINMAAIGKKAIAGAYADPNNAVARLHQSKVKPKFDLINAPPVSVKSGAKMSSYDNMIRKPN
jgi:predicted nucleic acid-binding Zn ribbon protein